MTILYMDIETLPTDDPKFIADLESTISAPANYKKPESIQAWMDENKDDILSDLVAKTGLNGLYGSIACICWALDDGEIRSHDLLIFDSEKKMLEAFFGTISCELSLAYHGGMTLLPTVVCGHNVAGFDLPFIKHRSIINQVKPCDALLKAMKAKPWDDCVADTMLMWSQDKDKRVSMDKLCKAFGIEGKGDMDGSKVAETWKTAPMKVIEYCMGDVERTRQLYKRMTFQ